jgi:hypothetical protein
MTHVEDLDEVAATTSADDGRQHIARSKALRSGPVLGEWRMESAVEAHLRIVGSHRSASENFMNHGKRSQAVPDAECPDAL